MSRQLFPQENFRNGKGLTSEQKRFDRLWREMAPIQKGREDLPFLGVGFKPAVKRDGPASRGRVEPLSAERLIVRAGDVNAVILHRIPTRFWRGARQNRQFRLQLVECPPYVYLPDGEIHVAPGEIPAASVYAADLSMNPRQDGPVLAERTWSPNQLIPTSPELSASWAGAVRVLEGDLYRDVTVDGHVAVRIPLDETDNVEVVVKDGDVVGDGDTLAVALSECRVGVAVLNSRRRPAIDRISPPLISATRRAPLLSLGLDLLEQMLARDVCWANPADVAPRQLAEFASMSEVVGLPSRPEWAETPGMMRDLCEACGPQGSLRVKSPWASPATYAGVDGRRHLFTVQGEQVSILLPPGAFMDVEPGETVEPGGSLAAWVSPLRPWTVEQLREAAGPFWSAIVASFLEDVAIRPGQAGYKGRGVLVPAAYVRTVAAAATDLSWMDFRPCQEYLTETGAVALPPIPHEDWQEFVFMLGEIGVDITPVGDRLTTSPITEHSRRADRSRSRSS